MQQRLKILITANHCAPNQGSEHGVGWNFVWQISQYHDVYLVCNKHDYIQGVIDFVNSEEGKKRNIKLYLVEQKVKYTKRIRFFPFLYYMDYERWQKNVYSLVSDILRTEPIDIIHHITNITFREPGFLWKLDKPFVWGPVGILGDEPIKFIHFYSRKEAFKMVIRRWTCIYQLNFSGRLKKAAQRAAVCLCVSNHAAQVMRKKLGARRTEVIPETGAILRDLQAIPGPRAASDPIQLLWVGRFDSSKGVLFLIEALKRIQEVGDIKYKLILVGDGDQREEALELCEEYDIDYAYKGYVPYTEVADLYQQSHLFFLTSLMDATTTVVFEALANYCPVIALNHLSFSEIVDQTCGAKIDLRSPEQIADDMASTIRHFYFHEEERYPLSLGARKKAEAYSWEKKMEQIHRIYQSLV